MGRVRFGLLLLSAAVVAAGVLGGWRVSVRFVGGGGGMRDTGGPAMIVKLPDAHALPDAGRPRRAVLPRVPLESAPGRSAAPGAVHRPPVEVPAAVAPRPTAGLHMTFTREWRPVTYEIRSPRKAPVRFLCTGCPALLEWDP